MNNIAVLHIMAGNEHGGAAKGTVSLHKELIQQGIHSILLKQVGPNDLENDIYSISQTAFSKVKRFFFTLFDRIPLLRYPRRQNIAFSPFVWGFDLTKSDHYKQADIIHLHWINQGMLSLKSLQNIKKPIVWTLRDMGVFTGGCHHSFHCEKYTNICGKCPILKSKKGKDLSFITQKQKIKYLPEKVKYVAISPWLMGCAISSTILKNRELQTIFNGIDTTSFLPLAKMACRKKLGIPVNKKIVCVGATNLVDPYKGFKYFVKCISWLESNEYHFLFFGKIAQKDIPDGVAYTSLGIVKNKKLLNEAYSAADVFVAPSVAEAFGKTIVEAMLAGTPVVCFDNSGPKDIVLHKITGYQATAYNSKDLAVGIQWCTVSPERNISLANTSRKIAVEKFSIHQSARKYIQLYAEVLNENK